MGFHSRTGLHGQGQMQNRAGFFCFGVPMEAWPRNYTLYPQKHVCCAKACAGKAEVVQPAALYRRDCTTITERTHDGAEDATKANDGSGTRVLGLGARTRRAYCLALRLNLCGGCRSAVVCVIDSGGSLRFANTARAL